MATIEDVARRAGVSIATVSRVLSPGSTPHPVNAETARRVREAAAELDFVPSALASGLATRRSGLVGLLVPDLADAHYPTIARGAEDAARREGLAVVVCNTLGDPSRLADYLRLLRSRRVDALVLSGGGSLTPDEAALVARSGLPCALIGRPEEGSPASAFPYVAVDNVAAAQQATHHLLEDARCRRVAHLAGPITQTTMRDRAEGYRQAVDAAGLRPDVVATDGSPEGAARAARTLLSRPPDQRPDGVFAAADRLAVPLLAIADDLGLRVPEDVAVIGFDDTPFAAYLRPSLSSVSQPGTELGEVAISLALRQLGRVDARPTEAEPAVSYSALSSKHSAPATPLAALSTQHSAADRVQLAARLVVRQSSHR